MSAFQRLRPVTTTSAGPSVACFDRDFRDGRPGSRLEQVKFGEYTKREFFFEKKENGDVVVGRARPAMAWPTPDHPDALTAGGSGHTGVADVFCGQDARRKWKNRRRSRAWHAKQDAILVRAKNIATAWAKFYRIDIETNR